MVNKQGVHPFNFCLFVVVVVVFIHLFFLKKFFVLFFLVNIQDALFLKKGKTRTRFSVVFLVLLSFLILLL